MSLDKLTTKIDDAAKGIQASSVEHNHRHCCKAISLGGAKAMLGHHATGQPLFLREAKCSHCQQRGHPLLDRAAFVLRCVERNCSQGSGWAWLGYSPSQKRLVVSSTANQDPLVTQVGVALTPCLTDSPAMLLPSTEYLILHALMQGLQPLLGCDMWEHAMYLSEFRQLHGRYRVPSACWVAMPKTLKFRARWCLAVAEYQNRKPEYLSNFWKVVNWKDVGERYEKVTAG